jgi:hypothetical protein
MRRYASHNRRALYTIIVWQSCFFQRQSGSDGMLFPQISLPTISPGSLLSQLQTGSRSQPKAAVPIDLGSRCSSAPCATLGSVLTPWLGHQRQRSRILLPSWRCLPLLWLPMVCALRPAWGTSASNSGVCGISPTDDGGYGCTLRMTPRASPRTRQTGRAAGAGL